SYEEFDEIKECTTAYEMWNKLKKIYGGDANVKRAKAESLRGQFDKMKMNEDENIAKYVERIKANVSAIRASGGTITDETVVSKVLRTLLPIYAIRVSAIQERRCEGNHNITLDALVGRLTAFELDNYDNYVPTSKNIESAFEAKVSLKKNKK
ncbi:retrotransposon gag domain-containing protein, partial [[Clostridium] innocuum]|uniref:retrotransposon gag domain-containing protein n=1 Tax=Clostridium innocuum TaxID=1522 RepID=UPI0005D26B0C